MVDGSLPLEDGKLPFFLLDAHEEQGTPGTLYLFGKVRHTQHLHPMSLIAASASLRRQHAWRILPFQEDVHLTVCMA